MRVRIFDRWVGTPKMRFIPKASRFTPSKTSRPVCPKTDRLALSNPPHKDHGVHSALDFKSTLTFVGWMENI